MNEITTSEVGGFDLERCLAWDCDPRPHVRLTHFGEAVDLAMPVGSHEAGNILIDEVATQKYGPISPTEVALLRGKLLSFTELDPRRVPGGFDGTIDRYIRRVMASQAFASSLRGRGLKVIDLGGGAMLVALRRSSRPRSESSVDSQPVLKSWWDLLRGR